MSCTYINLEVERILSAFLFISQEILEQEMSIVRSQLKQTTDRSDELEKVIAKCKKLRFC